MDKLEKVKWQQKIAMIRYMNNMERIVDVGYDPDVEMHYIREQKRSRHNKRYRVDYQYNVTIVYECGCTVECPKPDDSFYHGYPEKRYLCEVHKKSLYMKTGRIQSRLVHHDSITVDNLGWDYSYTGSHPRHKELYKALWKQLKRYGMKRNVHKVPSIDEIDNNTIDNYERTQCLGNNNQKYMDTITYSCGCKRIELKPETVWINCKIHYQGDDYQEYIELYY